MTDKLNPSYEKSPSLFNERLNVRLHEIDLAVNGTRSAVTRDPEYYAKVIAFPADRKVVPEAHKQSVENAGNAKVYDFEQGRLRRQEMESQVSDLTAARALDNVYRIHDEEEAA